MVSKYWKVGFIILIAVGAAGALALLINPKTMGTTAQVPWGLLIGTYVFFAVSSTGLGLISSLGPVFGVKKYDGLSLKVPVISLILLLCGFASLGLELGRPLNLIYILFSPNPAAPIWRMGFFYSLFLIILIIQFFMILRKNGRFLPLTDRIIFFVKLAALSNLGAVFGSNSSRPFWEGAYFPVIMIIAAIASGAAIISIISYYDEDFTTEAIFTDMGRLLITTLILLGIGSFWKFIIAASSNVPGNYLAAAVLNGPQAFSFWGVELIIGVILPVFLLIYYQFSRKVILYSSIFTLVGLVAGRLNFLSAGQMAPLFPRDSFVYFNMYSPSLAEWAIFFGTVGAAGLLIATVGRKFARLGSSLS